MHDLKFLRSHRERVEAGVALKGMTVDLERFYEIEERRLALLHESEQLKARRNGVNLYGQTGLLPAGFGDGDRAGAGFATG